MQQIVNQGEVKDIRGEPDDDEVEPIGVDGKVAQVLVGSIEMGPSNPG